MKRQVLTSLPFRNSRVQVDLKSRYGCTPCIYNASQVTFENPEYRFGNPALAS